MKSIFEYSKKKRKTQYYNRTASSYEEFGLSLKDMTEKLLNLLKKIKRLKNKIYILLVKEKNILVN